MSLFLSKFKKNISEYIKKHSGYLITYCILLFLTLFVVGYVSIVGENYEEDEWEGNTYIAYVACYYISKYILSSKSNSQNFIIRDTLEVAVPLLIMFINLLLITGSLWDINTRDIVSLARDYFNFLIFLMIPVFLLWIVILIYRLIRFMIIIIKNFFPKNNNIVSGK